MKWNQIIEQSPQNNYLFSASKINVGQRSLKKKKFHQTPDSQQFRQKKQNDELLQNSFSALIGTVNYEDDHNKKTMHEVCKALTEIKKIQHQQLQYQKKVVQLLEQKGKKERSTAKKSMTSKSANKSTIKKQKHDIKMTERMNTKIKRLQTDVKTIKIQLNQSKKSLRLGKKSESVAKLNKMKK